MKACFHPLFLLQLIVQVLSVVNGMRLDMPDGKYWTSAAYGADHNQLVKRDTKFLPVSIQAVNVSLRITNHLSSIINS
jgi:hypothetical protein